MTYLTEDLLYEFLRNNIKDEIIRNKQVANSNSKGRPDFRIESIKLIIEFDGYQHYSSVRTILRDIDKDKCYRDKGYTIIRIPYFIQLTERTADFLFSEYFTIVDFSIIESTINDHGFISNKAMLPADFCELGLRRFKNDLEYFSICKSDIELSIKNKCYEANNDLSVLPPSFLNMLT